MDIGNNIQNIRVTKGLSQVEISQLLGMDNSTYSRIEKKGNKIDFEEILRIAKVLDVSVYELINSEKDEKTLTLESKLTEVENALNQTEREKSLVVANCLDFINSAIEHKFCSAYFAINDSKKIFEDITFSELQHIYETELCNDYLVYFALKRNFINNTSLVNIHKNFINSIEEQMKNHHKKFSDFIRINSFQP
jgi:transcriptional regulator with XRE-family HTH domain